MEIWPQNPASITFFHDEYHMEQIAPKEALDDIRRFVHTELSDLTWERQESIVTNSAGIFIYAVTVARYLRPPNFHLSPMQKEERLDTLLTTRLVAVASDRQRTRVTH
jgi:hypothetical protein